MSYRFNDKHDKIRLSKIGEVKIRYHREIEGKIKTLTIVRQGNKWFACFSCVVEERPLPQNNEIIAINRGIRAFLTDREGNIVENPRLFVKSEERLAELQRVLARRVKGSNRWKEIKAQINNLHKKIANQRRYFHHTVSTEMIRNYGKILTEDFNTAKMLEEKKISKDISDAGWRQFNDMLEYKGKLYGREVILVDPAYISQICINCGNVAKKHGATYKCDKCKIQLNIDVNAAENVFRRANIMASASPA